MNTAIMKYCLCLCALFSPLAVLAQEEHDHSGGEILVSPPNQPAITPDQDHNQGHMNPHDESAPAGSGWSWSYLDRDNPQPHLENRWVMIPVAGQTHAFRFVGDADPATACASLDERRIMVDRATRLACQVHPEVSPFQGVGAGAAKANGAAHHDNHSNH